MKRFKNILAVYSDRIGADDALSHAVTLAQMNDAQLTIIDVGHERYMTSPELAERSKRLQRLSASIEAEGLEEVSSIAIAGTPFLEIIRQVLKAHHDLVIAAAEPSLTFRDYFFGSTATHLMRKCPCPVWIVKPGQTSGYKRIMACVDPKSSDENEAELDRKILDLATSLSMRNNAELHIVNAWEVDGNDLATLTSEVSQMTRERILVKHECKHRNRVDHLLKKYPMEIPSERLHSPRTCEPHWAILEVVDKLNVDLIVMGTVCRTGISGYFIGNAAEAVLSLVKCGVFTVKPNGFVSPVVLENTPAKLETKTLKAA